MMSYLILNTPGSYTPPPFCTELSGDDHAPVTRGRMRTQYLLPHGRL